MGKLTGLLGILAILCIAYLFSTNQKMIRIKTLAWGLGLQFAFALLVLKTSAGQAALRVCKPQLHRDSDWWHRLLSSRSQA